MNSAIAALIRTRRVICRLAMVFRVKGGGDRGLRRSIAEATRRTDQEASGTVVRRRRSVK